MASEPLDSYNVTVVWKKPFWMSLHINSSDKSILDGRVLVP